jgi:hypothetical protein
MKTSKLPHSKAYGGSAHRPKTGIADTGLAMDPGQLPEKASHDPDSQEPGRAAPAPRVPIADEVYEQLKRKAKTTRLRRSKHGQEDPSR